MTLQQRLIVAVLVAAPVAWLLTIAGTYWRAEHEINELYDTDMLRLAQQALAVARLLPADAAPSPEPLKMVLPGDLGAAELQDWSLAVWRGAGDPLVADPEAQQFPRNGTREGFFDSVVDDVSWRLFYLNDPASGTRVAVGQRLGERKDLIVSYIASQILPLLVSLPVLIVLLIVAVRRAIRPVRDLSHRLERRDPDDDSPLPLRDTPGELRILVQAMNGLLARVASLIEQERRLTADAAHELRTPLAALRAQWDVAQRAEDPAQRRQAQASVTRGLERLDRLVAQLLTMARLDSVGHLGFGGEIDWRCVAEQAVGDCLWIANRRDIEIEVEWPENGEAPLPIAGDTDALVIMLRNVLDNAVRYGPRHSRVRLSFTASRIHVDDQGSGMPPEVLARIGDRFLRAAGNEESGSGLGVSIARRIARNHGLNLRFEMRPAGGDFGPGLRVTILRGS
ncbi:ATP-binding protein [Bordetella genomosp. 11]|uniref:histidine kinase n=1 Tax=Bordetella genomosp. 11 TaxID=1416808 RepID=A0A261UIN9_9BORD|nr:ATP-binding protein [Bordetella genomosp. 11]OZI60733.1 two-component sensor histidine kinase [Bordetella genomosp. 11]